ncbi:MAG: Nif11-like leader peptide family natural product precursor [Oscillospiraceae bacterium]|nr:Nif11-like leader peptide family natural product precursor [Oscillospiraceae bacterium]
MNKMQAFIEKAKTDKDLLAKLDALGASGAGPDKVVALAAEYGFTVTEEECRRAAEKMCPHRAKELTEE